MRNSVPAYLDWRVLRAIAAALLILSAGGVAIFNGASPSDVGLPLLVLLVVGAIFGSRYVRRKNAAAEEAAFRELVRAKEARRP